MTTTEEYFVQLEDVNESLKNLVERLERLHGEYLEFFENEYGRDAMTKSAQDDVEAVQSCIAGLHQNAGVLDDVLYGLH